MTIPKKIRHLRLFLNTRITNSLAWLIRKTVSERQLNFLQDIMQKMIELNAESQKPLLKVDDKVSYLNVAFAAILKNSDKKILDFEKVEQFCQELVENECSHPEPYLYFIMIHFPTKGKTDHLVLLRKSIDKLETFEKEYREPQTIGNMNIKQKLFPLFFLSKDNHEGFERLIPTSTINGRHLAIEVGLKLPCSRSTASKLKVELNVNRSDKLLVKIGEGKNNTNNFRFAQEKIMTYFTFTYGGPRAYSFGQDDLETEREKLQLLMDSQE